MAISRQLDDALYRLKVTVLTRLAQRLQSRLSKAKIEQEINAGHSPEDIARHVVERRRTKPPWWQLWRLWGGRSRDVT